MDVKSRGEAAQMSNIGIDPSKRMSLPEQHTTEIDVADIILF